MARDLTPTPTPTLTPTPTSHLWLEQFLLCVDPIVRTLIYLVVPLPVFLFSVAEPYRFDKDPHS